MTLAETAAFLAAHDDYCILTHVRPDGDTLGSAAALCAGLRAAGKKAYLFPNPGVTETYQPYIAEFLTPASSSPLYVAVDIADTTLYPDGFSGAAVALCIDHHPSNANYAENTFCMPEKASCGEIIFLVLKALGVAITKEIADLLYVAVSTDTGCFCYANTKADTLRAAAELLDLGADSALLNKRHFRSSTFSRLRLEGMVFSSLRSYHDGKVIVAIVSLEMIAAVKATEDDCEDLAGLPGRVTGNDVGVLIREQENGSSKVSVRTNGRVNASEVCKEFGGGGHAMAAGCTIEQPYEAAAEALLRVIDRYFQ